MDGHIPEPTPEVVSLFDPISAQTLFIASFSLALLCLALLALFNRRKYSSRGNALILVGASDAGKTSILSKLVYGKRLQTHTSLQSNISTISLSESKKTIRVVDIPGHPRVRDQFREHLNDAKVVGFVVDTSTISRNGAAVAEHLHLILHSLTSLPPSQKPPNLLIVAHKIDLMKVPAAATTASEVSINRVRTILERELERRRMSQTNGVGVEGLGEEGEREMGGLDCGGSGGIFKFVDWEGGEVSFVGTWLKDEEEKVSSEDGLTELRSWLEESM